jgi:NAD(P)-dependent dehydrogenase (short-subunit alcohol dehydrogenase family)
MSCSSASMRNSGRSPRSSTTRGSPEKPGVSTATTPTKNGGPGGVIVNLSSLAAQLGGGNQWIPYAAAKGAINSFTVGLAKEVAAEGIRVNAIAPGLVQTEIHAEAGVGDRLQKVLPQVPMGRIGTAEECAEAILWLMSGEAAYMIGSVLTLSGGR